MLFHGLRNRLLTGFYTFEVRHIQIYEARNCEKLIWEYLLFELSKICLKSLPPQTDPDPKSCGNLQREITLHVESLDLSIRLNAPRSTRSDRVPVCYCTPEHPAVRDCYTKALDFRIEKSYFHAISLADIPTGVNESASDKIVGGNSIKIWDANSSFAPYITGTIFFAIQSPAGGKKLNLPAKNFPVIKAFSPDSGESIQVE